MAFCECIIHNLNYNIVRGHIATQEWDRDEVDEGLRGHLGQVDTGWIRLRPTFHQWGNFKCITISQVYKLNN